MTIYPSAAGKPSSSPSYVHCHTSSIVAVAFNILILGGGIAAALYFNRSYLGNKRLFFCASGGAALLTVTTAIVIRVLRKETHAPLPDPQKRLRGLTAKEIQTFREQEVKVKRSCLNVTTTKVASPAMILPGMKVRYVSENPNTVTVDLDSHTYEFAKSRTVPHNMAVHSEELMLSVQRTLGCSMPDNEDHQGTAEFLVPDDWDYLKELEEDRKQLAQKMLSRRCVFAISGGDRRLYIPPDHPLRGLYSVEDKILYLPLSAFINPPDEQGVYTIRHEGGEPIFLKFQGEEDAVAYHRDVLIPFIKNQAASLPKLGLGAALRPLGCPLPLTSNSTEEPQKGTWKGNITRPLRRDNKTSTTHFYGCAASEESHDPDEVALAQEVHQIDGGIGVLVPDQHKKDSASLWNGTLNIPDDDGTIDWLQGFEVQKQDRASLHLQFTRMNLVVLALGQELSLPKSHPYAPLLTMGGAPHKEIGEWVYGNTLYVPFAIFAASYDPESHCYVLEQEGHTPIPIQLDVEAGTSHDEFHKDSVIGRLHELFQNPPIPTKSILDTHNKQTKRKLKEKA